MNPDIDVQRLLREAEEAATGKPLSDEEAREIHEWASQQRDLSDAEESLEMFPAWKESK